MLTKIRMTDFLINTSKKSINEMIDLSKEHNDRFIYELFYDDEDLISLNILCDIGEVDNRPKIYTTLSKKKALYLGETLILMSKLMEDDQKN